MLDDTYVENLRQTAARHQAWCAAVRYLRAMKSTAEVRRHLAKKGHSPEAVDHAIRKLVERGYLDDRQYAAALIRSLKNSRKVGKRYLEAALYKRGIAGSIAKEALAEFEGPIEEVADAVAALQKKMKAGITREKAARFLTGRGFSFDTALKAIRELGILPENSRSDRDEID